MSRMSVRTQARKKDKAGVPARPSGGAARAPTPNSDKGPRGKGFKPGKSPAPVTAAAPNNAEAPQAAQAPKAAAEPGSKPVTKKGPPPMDPNMKTALITGGNTGIGYATAAALGAKGYHTVIACRNEARGKAALQKLRDGNPSGSFELRVLRLDDLSNVKDFCKQSVDFGHSVDVLVNNAGVMACPEMQTRDGHEYQLGVNHLGHFALTGGLLPLMSDPNRSSRIVNVSSSAHLFGDINFDDINCTKKYQKWLAYGQSKLANVLFTFELAKRVPYSAKLTCNALHPGVVATELQRYLTPDSPPFYYPFIEQVMANFLKTPEQGAETSIYLATSDAVEGITSKYFVDCMPKTPSYKVFDPELRAKFWDLSCEMTGMDFDVDALLKVSSTVKEEVTV